MAQQWNSQDQTEATARYGVLQSNEDTTAAVLDTLVTNAYNSKAYNSILDQEASA